jgi:hypothetical protein
MIWCHPQIMMICSSLLNWIQVSLYCYILVNLPGPTRLPSGTTDRSHYNPPSSCMHKNTHFCFLPTKLTPPLKRTGSSFGKFQMPLTHVQSWSVTPHRMTRFFLSIHSFGLGPMGQSPCVLGSFLICSNTLEQLLLGNQCVPVVQLLWQKLVLLLSLSRVLVNGVLLLLSGISERILWCYMHSSFCNPCTMTPLQLRQPKCLAFLLILMLNRTKTFSSTLSFHTLHLSPSHMLIYSLRHLPKKKKTHPPFPLV